MGVSIYISGLLIASVLLTLLSPRVESWVVYRNVARCDRR